MQIEYDRVTDLMDAYFAALKQYNRALGAFEMTPAMLADARRREADTWTKVHNLKTKLLELGVCV